MKKHLIILLLLCYHIPLLAQLKGYNRIYFSYTKHNYYDKKSIKNDNVLPNNHIDPRNGDGHSWAIQYERVTTSGLCMSIELQRGKRNYDISIRQDMTGFDPEAVKSLTNLQYNIGGISGEIHYLTPKILIGYSLKCSKKLAITGKAGISKRLFYYTPTDISFNIKYKTDNNLDRQVSNFMNVHRYYGTDDINYKEQLESMASYECYLGVDYQLNKLFLKNVAFGIELSRGISIWNHNEYRAIYASPSINQIGASRETLIDRNMSIGLRLAVGLWK